MLSPEELERVLPAETSSYPSPVPAQIVSNDEYTPSPPTAKQKEYEARIKELGAQLAEKQGLSRSVFFKSAGGMAAAFLAMNDTYGPIEKYGDGSSDMSYGYVAKPVAWAAGASINGGSDGAVFLLR